MDNLQETEKRVENISLDELDLINNSKQADFPILEAPRKSASIVALLKDIMFSKCGEFTKINKYYFQSWHTFVAYPNLSRELKQIAVEATDSFYELGKAVVLFGGNPIFSNSNGAYWNGIYVSQQSKPTEFLSKNLEEEKCSIKKIREIQTEIDNTSLSAVLDIIVSRKLQYIQIFERYLSNLN